MTESCGGFRCAELAVYDIVATPGGGLVGRLCAEHTEELNKQLESEAGLNSLCACEHPKYKHRAAPDDWCVACDCDRFRP